MCHHYASITHTSLHTHLPLELITQQSEGQGLHFAPPQNHAPLWQVHLLHAEHLCPDEQKPKGRLLVPSHFTLHSQRPLPLLGKPQHSVGHGVDGQPTAVQNTSLFLQPHLLHKPHPVCPGRQGLRILLALEHSLLHTHLRLSADSLQQSPIQGGQPIKVHSHLPFSQRQILQSLHLTWPFLHS